MVVVRSGAVESTMSSLMYAAENGDVDTVKQLLAEGAPVDAANGLGQTPLTGRP